MVVVESPWPNVEPPRNLSFPQYLLDAAARHGQLPAIVQGEREYSYADFIVIVKQLSAALQQLGVRKGDRIGTFLGSVAEYVFLFTAATRLGAIVSSCNPDYTTYELAKQFTDCGVTYIFTDSTSVEKVVSAKAKLPLIKLTTFSNLLNSAKPGDDATLPMINTKGDLAFILYSSGTTGLPKGVMTTHDALVANHYIATNIVGGPHVMRLGPNDVSLTVFPLFHAGGFLSFIIPFVQGACSILLPNYNPAAFLGLIQARKVTTVFIVPPVAVLLAKSPLVDQFDLSSVRHFICGAAPLGKEICDEVSQRLSVKHVLQQYGMTELGFLSFFSPDTDLTTTKSGSCGMLLPNQRAMVVDTKSLKPVGPNQPGELWLQPPTLMKGYLNNPEATRQTVTPDGWMRTGDIAYFDDDHYFFIIDRLKELIKVRGFQVAPAELEALILTHAAVADVIVVGVPDAYSGELPRAYVVLKPAKSATAADIEQLIARSTVHYKHLKAGVRFVDELPKTGSGKLLRRQLKAEAAEEQQQPRANCEF